MAATEAWARPLGHRAYIFPCFLLADASLSFDINNLIMVDCRIYGVLFEHSPYHESHQPCHRRC